MKFHHFCLILVFGLHAFAAHAETAATKAPCDDSAKVYKACHDQEELYRADFDRAKSEGKLLAVTLGAEWCPWCLALHHMFKDQKFASEPTARQFVFSSISLYQGKEKLPSGEKVLATLKELAKYKEKISGVPVLVVVNPANAKANFIDTEPLEKNTKKKKGHDTKKVVNALEKAASAVR
ncbi:MAG TPA: hypothetical protein VIH99_08195 [Bdellovibrionota bacterium]|jgi:hypothetical protein